MPTTTPHPGMLLDDMTAEEAKVLNDEVDNLIATHAKASVELYVGLGRHLAKIHAGRGYRQLGFPTWKAYLHAKPDFGLTYLSYMVKLGEAAEADLLDLTRYTAEGLTGSQLLEYAKATDFPKYIIDLIDMTWPEVKGKSVAEAQRIIRQWVDAHWETYKSRPKTSPQDKPGQNWETGWESEFKDLDDQAKADFIKQMWSFLEHHDSGVPPHDD